MTAARRAALFDLDGTLVDSLPDIAAALVAALAEVGEPAPALAVVRGWVGGGARQLVAQAVAGRHDVDAVLARFLAHYGEAPAAATALYPGVAEALDALVAAGWRLAVLTNKPDHLALEIAAARLARWPFAAIRGALPGVPLKPDPAAARALARDLGLPPEACVFVGDAPSDVAAGRAAGMRTVAVTWGYRSRAELAAAGADALCDEPAALAAALLG